MRVIAGNLRSRTLHAPKGRDTRPTHDRVREALFSVLGPMTDFNVLDLCAGTGALGIEALSRGARHAVFVECARDAVVCLARNLDELGLGNTSTIVAQTVQSSRTRLHQHGPYDLVFCDPPWADVPEMLRALRRLELSSLIAKEGVLVLEHAAKFEPDPCCLPGLTTVTTRRWGDTAVTLFGEAAETTETTETTETRTTPIDGPAP